MSAPASPATGTSAAQLARRRRHDAWRRGWREVRRHRSGVAGLVVLVLARRAHLLAD